MNAQAQEVESEVATTTKAKKAPEVEKVKMEDGREVEFVGKRRLNKEYFLKPDGSLDYIQLDFRNGVVRKIYLPESLLGQFAGHGALQKYGDELAGYKPEDDIDDLVLAIDQLDENIQAGKWSTRKEGDGLGGTSILIKALVAYGGKTVEQVKAFLKDKDAKFKAAIRADDKKPSKLTGKTVAQHVKELEAEKLSKGAKIDTDAALEGLDSF